jgi:hypothetical protein
MGAGACGWGDMDGCTYIETPGDEYYYHEDLDEDGDLDFIRGHAITLEPRGYGTGDPVDDVTMRGFHLNGGTDGWTGCYSFNYDQDIKDEDCWDLSHSGIYLGGGNDTDDILIEDVEVNQYKGEVIYNGGFSAGRIVLRRVWSHDSNASANNIATAEYHLAEDSKFGPKVRFWGEFLAEGIPNATHIHRNNIYEGCNTGNGCLAMAVDDFENLVDGQTFTWKNNTFNVASSNSTKRLFLLSAGPYDFNLKNNTIEGGELWISNNGSGAKTTTLDVSGNTHYTKGAHPFQFQGGSYQGSISDNTFLGNGAVYRAVGGDLTGLIIENNVYENEEGISFGGSGPDPYPLFQNNTYMNEGVPVPSNLFSDQTVTAYIQRKSFTSGPNGPYNAELESKAADGQRVWLFGDQRQVTFPSEYSNHGWANDISLSSPDDSAQVEFESASGTWTLIE